MTLAISDTEQAPERRRPNYDIEYWTVKDHKRNRYTRVASLAPVAVNVSYQLHLWARYVEDMNQLLEYVMNKFRPHLRVETDFMINACAFITAVGDNSMLTVGDREDRIIKKTITFNVETYMPTRQYMIQSNGEIREMHYVTSVDTGIKFNTSGGPGATSGSEDLVVYSASGPGFRGPTGLSKLPK